LPWEAAAIKRHAMIKAELSGSRLGESGIIKKPYEVENTVTIFVIQPAGTQIPPQIG
jgi:hypothetical protein